MKAAGYVGTASDSSDSQTKQREAIKQYCDENNLTLVNIYEDLNCLEPNMIRPQYDQLIKDAGNGEFDLIVVEKISRIIPSPSLIVDFFSNIDIDKISIISTDDWINTTHTIGRISILAIQTGRAHEARLAKRIREENSN